MYAEQKINFKTFLIYLYLFFLIVGGNALTFNVAGRVAIKVSEIIAILLGLVFFNYFTTTRWTASVSVILWWAVLSLLLIFVNTFFYRFGFSDFITACLYLFRFIYAILLSFVLFLYAKKKKIFLSVLKLINIFYIFVCVIGFFQLLFYPHAYDFYNIFWKIGVYYPNADPHINRLISTYFDPNYLASCLLIGIAVDLYLLKRIKKFGGGTTQKIVYFLFLIIYVVTILLTKSRSGILGFGCLLVVTLLLWIDWKHLKLWQITLFAIGVFAALYLVFFSDIEVFVRIRNVFHDDSASARFASWRKGFGILHDTNYIGIGYNLFGAYNEMKFGIAFESSGYGNDSSLLLILITTGIVGFVIYVFHLIKLIGTKKSPAPIIGLVFSALVICNFNNLLFYSLWVSVLYLVIFTIQELEKSTRRLNFAHINHQ